MIVVALLVVAGFLTLLNSDFGHALMLLAAFTTAVYVFNGVVWALLDAFVAPIIPKDDKPTRKK